MRRAVERFTSFKKPIYILENGVPDRADRIRPWLLQSAADHIRALLNEGVDLRGYFHRSLTDNFEWNEGWHLRFGLYELDPKTQAARCGPARMFTRRLLKRAGMGTAEIARTARNARIGD